MKDQSEPQPPSDDSNGEEPVFIPPLFMALLHPEDYPQSVFIKALRPLWRSSTYQKILEEGRAEVRAEGRAEGRGGSEENSQATRDPAIWKARRPHRGRA